MRRSSFVLTVLLGCRLDTGGLGEGAPPVTQGELPGASGDRICDWYFRCGCEATEADPYASEAACATEIEAEVQAAIDEGVAAELVYDGKCAGELLGLLDDFGCDKWSEAEPSTQLHALERLQCKLFYGEGEAGATCDALTLSGGDSCGQTSTCEQGTCTPIASAPGPGDACAAEDLCSDGASCVDVDGVGDLRCEQLPAESEPCLGSELYCGIGLSCSQISETCEPAPGVGKQCADTPFECQEGLYCPASNQCAALPPAGEPCVVGNSGESCAAGLACVEGICEVEPALVCTLGPRVFEAGP